MIDTNKSLLYLYSILYLLDNPDYSPQLFLNLFKEDIDKVATADIKLILHKLNYFFISIKETQSVEIINLWTEFQAFLTETLKQRYINN